MSELKKPTIEGLIEKLLEENHIQENEAGTVQALLAQASNGLNKDEIFTLVTKLNDKLDAHTSDLITPNGLNYSVFESEVKTVAQVINKEKIQREKSQAQVTVDPLQEKREVEKTPEEKAEIERQERIAENRKYFDSMLNDIPGADKLGFTEEDKDKIGEAKYKLDEFWKYREQYIKDGMAEDVATQKAMKRTGLTEKELKSGEYLAAAVTIANQNGEQVEKGNLAREDAEKQGRVLMQVVGESDESAQEIINDTLGGPEKGKGAVFKALSKAKQRINEVVQKDSKSKSADIRAVIYDPNTQLDIKNLRSYINWRENEKIVSSELDKKELDPEEEKKRKRFFKNLTKLYLSSDRTISEMYDRVKDNVRAKYLELEFEDFLDGIKENLELDVKDDPLREYDLRNLITIEREIRRFDLLHESVEIAKLNGKKVDKEQQKELEKIAKKEAKDLEGIKQIKGKFARRRGIEVKEQSSNNTKRKKKPTRRPKDPKKQLEEDITRMSNDKKQIIKISKEKGISTDEAAKIYFTENNKALRLYSVKERKILTGSNELDKKIIKPSKTIQKIRTFTKEKNDALIKMYNIDIERLNEEINNLKNSFDNPRELDRKLFELEKNKKKLKKAKERNEKLQKKSKSKNAIDIIDKKITKKEEEKIFARYLESGKSAVDIFDEIVANGNEYEFDKEDMIRIVEEGARKYLQSGSELNSLVENEKLLFGYKTSLTSLHIKKENAEKKGLDDWTVSYNKQIAELEANQKTCEQINKKYKNKISIRMGLKPNEIGRTDGTTQAQETAQIPNSGESKTNNAIDLNQIQEEQVRGSKNGLAVEEIEVTGVKPNVKAIAKKNKVTPKRIKEAFSKIVGFKKSKQEVVEQTEQDVNLAEKTTQTNTEGIR